MKTLTTMLIISALVFTGCHHPQVGNAPADASCRDPEPDPCIRRGEALAGGAAWLIQVLDETLDATAAAEATNELYDRVMAWERCLEDMRGPTGAAQP